VDDVASRAAALAADRVPFVRATVVRAQHPTSAHAGDAALVLPDGRIEGFVGGECAEGSVRAHGLRVLAEGAPLLLRILPGAESESREEGAVTVANPCHSGGALEIFLEPQSPPPRVVVVGDTPIARALRALGGSLGFDVAVTADGGISAPRQDDAALVVASHGRGEVPALEAALHAGVPYVALVASHRRGPAVLAALDVPDHLRSRVVTPAGLDIGARTAPEVALSILAQLIATRATPRPEPAHAPDQEPAPPAPSAVAVDPVCGMTVAAVPASLHVEHEGRTVYFCGGHCRDAFVAEPGRYAR
jgi:xanthine dehydrogenase accessory factor